MIPTAKIDEQVGSDSHVIPTPAIHTQEDHALICPYKTATATQSLVYSISTALDQPMSLADMDRARSRIGTFTADTVSSLKELITKHRWPFSKERLDRGLSQLILTALSYRFKMRVTEMRMYNDSIYGETGYYVCPRCKVTMEREFQSYCDRCGQALDWKGYSKVKVVKTVK